MEEGYGAAILKQPQLIEDLVKAARAAVPRWRVVSTPEGEERQVPFAVSIKIRLVPCPPRAIGEDDESSAPASWPNVRGDQGLVFDIYASHCLMFGEFISPLD